MSSFFAKFKPEGLSQRLTPKTTDGNTKRKIYTEGLSMKEIAKHNTRSDCWFVIEDKVYDVSNWVDKHPGGDVLLSYAGRDATDIFDAFHDDSSYRLLKGFYIGQANDVQVSPALKAHRELKKKLENQNLFEASTFYYIYKFMTNVALMAMGIAACSYGDSIFRVIIGGILIGLFWQQCGWLSHDFLHHQVFKNRSYNNAVGYITGNVFQGFSVSWWKAKHNLHHACPNVAGFDPDIDTLPFLAWSEKLIEGELEGLPQFLVKYQYIFYFPLLSAARISWLIQSFLFGLYKSAAAKRNTEVITLLLHYTWYFSVIYFTLTWKEAILFVILSQATTGLFLASAFSLGHNGMSIITKNTFNETDFNKLQILTGRDVSGPSFVHWFMGGLDLQVEHHLYPKIPRHNLSTVQQYVVKICKDNNIHHHMTGFWDGTKETISTLFTVSENAVPSK